MLQRSLDRARARRSDEGFTLIELLIVIVILGVLAAIVVFSVSGINNSSDKAACQANFQTAETAIEAYYANPDTSGITTATYPTSLSSLVPKFLASDPSASTVDAKTRVTYAQTGGGTGYTLTSGSSCSLSH